MTFAPKTESITSGLSQRAQSLDTDIKSLERDYVAAADGIRRIKESSTRLNRGCQLLFNLQFTAEKGKVQAQVRQGAVGKLKTQQQHLTKISVELGDLTALLQRCSTLITIIEEATSLEEV